MAQPGVTARWPGRLLGGRSFLGGRFWALSAGSAVALSCGGVAAPPARAAEVPEPAAAAPAPSFSGSFRVIEATGQSLTFPLPDAGGWRRDTREARSWVAFHRATQSRLVVRAWRHDAIARVEDCEQQARLWRPELPAMAPGDLVEDRQVTLAGTYASRVSLGVVADEGASLQGHALAFGSDARDCLMLAFSTAASGPGASRAVAGRLGLIAERVFGRVHRLAIDERVVVPRL